MEHPLFRGDEVLIVRCSAQEYVGKKGEVQQIYNQDDWNNNRREVQKFLKSNPGAKLLDKNVLRNNRPNLYLVGKCGLEPLALRRSELRKLGRPQS